MLLPHLAVWMVSVGMMVLGAGVLFGQTYPNKPIRIVTGPLGGALDFVSRIIAQGISDPLGQPVIVENRPGIIAGETVAKAPPDGYYLTLNAGAFWIGPLFVRTVPYDPVKDFLPISLTNRAPNVLVVHPSLPVKSVKELIALAKARPGELNYSSGSTGGSSHLAGALFSSAAGVNILRVSYTSGSQEITDLLSGQMQMSFGTAIEMSPHIKSGRLRALAITSAQPSALFPELPTVAASGVPGYDYGSMTGIFAPAKTPATIINRLNQEIVRFLKTAGAKEQLLSRGSEAVGSSPEELGATIKSDIAKVSKLIKDTGMRAD